MYPKVLSLVALVALFTPSFAADCTRSYTVKAGDYCDKISRENNVSTFQLAALNTGKYNNGCTDLAVGSVLCLGAVPTEDCQTTRTVKPGDTCDAISSAAGTNNTILYHNNPQIDAKCFNIYVGEVLCVAQSGQVPPTPSSGVTVPVTGPPANPPSNPPPQSSTTAITVPAVGGATPVVGAASPTPTIPTDDGNDDDLPFCVEGDDGY